MNNSHETQTAVQARNRILTSQILRAFAIGVLDEDTPLVEVGELIRLLGIVVSLNKEDFDKEQNLTAVLNSLLATWK